MAGSSMSSRQMASAAVEGRKVSFFLTLDSGQIVGYVIGADDYHWMVAARPDELDDESVTVMLIHKPAAGFIALHQEATLDSEPDSVKAQVEELGSGFWNYCRTHYFGQTPVSEED